MHNYQMHFIKRLRGGGPKIHREDIIIKLSKQVLNDTIVKPENAWLYGK